MKYFNILLFLILFSCGEEKITIEDKAYKEIERISEVHNVSKDAVETIFFFYLGEKHQTILNAYFKEDFTRKVNSGEIDIYNLTGEYPDRLTKVMADIKMFCNKEY